MASTELFENPFVALGLPIAATNEQIVEAYDEQLAAFPDRESELMAARRALLSPKLRLTAEIGFLPGTPEADVAQVRAALRAHKQQAGEWLILANRLPPPARSNVLLHAVQVFGPEPAVIYDFVDAQAGADPEDVLSAIGEARDAAGVVPAQRDAVIAELAKWAQRQRAILFERCSDTAQLADTLRLVTTRVLSLRDDRHADILDELLHAYWRRAAAEAEIIRSRLRETGKGILSNVWTAPDITGIVEDLHRWQKLAYPLQALESAKGRDEPESHAVFLDARDVYISLANDRRLPDVATSIARAIQPTVSMLPRASERLEDDLAALRPLVDEQQCSKLFNALDVIRSDVMAGGGASVQLRSDLATPQWHAVWDGLDEAVAKLGDRSDMPWVAVRQLSLFLFNDALQKRVAQAVTLKLQGRAAAAAPPHVIELLKTDASDMGRFLLEDEVTELVGQQKWNKAARAADQLLKMAPDAQTVASYSDLRAQIKIKQRGRIGAWAVPIAIALGIFLLSHFNRSSQPRYSPPPLAFSPPPSGPAVSTPVPSFGNPVEQRPPPIGDAGGQTITQANVRYCLFEDARLEHLRSLVSISESLVRRFNAAVQDWNDRCSRYMYRPSDMTLIERELAGRGDILRAEARSRLEEWRR